MKRYLFSMLAFIAIIAVYGQRRGMQVRDNIPTDSIRLSDPFVLADDATHTYYMTGTGGLMWKSKDLYRWSGPYNVAKTDPQSWMGPRPMIWAAELHKFKDKYYYFATFTNQAVMIDTVRGNAIERRASHVLVSDKAEGPYVPMADETYLPANKPTLDGTFWVDTDGKPYMVYCWEWLQQWDGTIDKIELKPDLSGSVGEGKILFRASDSPWSREKDENGNDRPNKVTDGPFLFRTSTGRLGMIWTSWVYDVYTQGVAYSESGTLDGPWIQEPLPITPPNFGHGMLFRDFNGQLLLSCHSHKKDAMGRTIRIPHFFKASLEGEKLTVEQTPIKQPKEGEPVNGQSWLDTDGNHINAHGGNIIRYEDRYYWYGESRPDRGGAMKEGISMYSSPDLKHWTNEGIVLSTSTEAGHDIEQGCIMERPKVVYNEKTKKFVMLFHLELKGKGYAAARVGFAVADNPKGPFTFLRSQRIHAGKWPFDMKKADRKVAMSHDASKWKDWWTPEWRKATAEGMYLWRDMKDGQMSRDMTVFIDDDGKAYHITSSQENLTLLVSELTSDYLNYTGKYNMIAPGGQNEAPVIFKHNGTYWLICSGCTGWAPNEARMFSSKSIWGPWKQHPTPFTDANGKGYNNMGAAKTFGAQGTYAIEPSPGNLLFMADIWNPQHLRRSLHLWLPIEFQQTPEGEAPVIKWQEEVKLSR